MRTAAAAVLAIAIAFSVKPLQACSTFCLKQDGAVVYGRNYDFDIGTGVVVNEVLAHAEDVRVRGGTPLHYLIADRSGAAATIEYLDGKLVVYTGSALPTAKLTNDSYASSLQYLRGQHAMPSGSGSLQRFARTAMLIAQPANGQNATDRTTDCACSQSPLALDVRSTMTGDVSAKLLPLSADDNLDGMLDAYASTSILSETPREWIEQSAAHAESFACVPARRFRAIKR
jgi:penicillin V acylase-like amidase (Ntn superfamily)